MQNKASPGLLRARKLRWLGDPVLQPLGLCGGEAVATSRPGSVPARLHSELDDALLEQLELSGGEPVEMQVLTRAGGHGSGSESPARQGRSIFTNA
jgi:hypothetical protein